MKDYTFHDPVWLLWPVAAASMLAAALLAAALPLAPEHWHATLSWWVGALALVGGGVLPVTAMLGKIVPFLVWLHLRRLLPPRRTLHPQCPSLSRPRCPCPQHCRCCPRCRAGPLRLRPRLPPRCSAEAFSKSCRYCS